MIPLNDCISVLDQLENSAAFTHFKSLSADAGKLKKEGGYRATQGLKKDGIEVHFDYVDRVWRISELHLYSQKRSRFVPYLGEIKSGVRMLDGRLRLVAALGAPSSSGGDGTVGEFGIVNRIWERWD